MFNEQEKRETLPTWLSEVLERLSLCFGSPLGLLELISNMIVPRSSRSQTKKDDSPLPPRVFCLFSNDGCPSLAFSLSSSILTLIVLYLHQEQKKWVQMKREDLQTINQQFNQMEAVS